MNANHRTFGPCTCDRGGYGHDADRPDAPGSPPRRDPNRRAPDADPDGAPHANPHPDGPRPQDRGPHESCAATTCPRKARAHGPGPELLPAQGLLLPHDRLPVLDGSVLTMRRLRSHGLTPALIAERCRPGGPWQQVLPQVYLLHSGPPSSEERIQAALLYAGRDPGAHGPAGGGREAMVTGLAALALHRFASVPPLTGLPAIDVLVPRQRRLRDAGYVAVHRARALPRAQDLAGLPCAPVPRALADAVARLDDAATVLRLLVEAVRGGHCDASAVVRELADAGLLELPYVAGALGALHAADRTAAEGRLYAMVRLHELPDPVWNVDLHLPGGPPLGGVDAYWPEHAMAVALDVRAAGAADDEAAWARHARLRERLEALGIALLHLTPAKLAGSLDQQAAVVRTALLASTDRTPAAYVVVTPR